MEIHPRLEIVTKAGRELSQAVPPIVKKYNLTYVELNEILLMEALNWNKYAKRAERHPNDPDKRGDEA
jgi:hypothetical protein